MTRPGDVSSRKITLHLSFVFAFTHLMTSGVSGAKVSGVVTDQSNQALPYVIVYVSGTSNGTTANSDGYYSLELKQGEYDISFRMIGFSLLTKHVIVGNDPVDLTVKMKEESVRLAEVT